MDLESVFNEIQNEKPGTIEDLEEVANLVVKEFTGYVGVETVTSIDHDVNVGYVRVKSFGLEPPNALKGEITISHLKGGRDFEITTRAIDDRGFLDVADSLIRQSPQMAARLLAKFKKDHTPVNQPG